MPTPYDLNLPCLNPQCKSHGRPHPNCRCYNFAEGGEVQHYCSGGRAHKEDCEYFMAEGGEVDGPLPSFDEMKAMSEHGESEPTPEELPSFDEMKADSGTEEGPSEELPSFDEMKALSAMPKEEPSAPLKSGPTDGLEQLKAGAEGVAQGLIGDLAKVVQVKTGISTLEDIERREKEFPATHGIAKGAAFAGSLAAGPARLITAGVGSKLLGNVLASTAYSLSDNTAKAFLGQPGGDVESVVAGTILRGGIEGMINTFTGGLFAAAPKAAKAVLNEKTVRMAENAMINFAEKPINRAARAALLGTGVGGVAGAMFGDEPGDAITGSIAGGLAGVGSAVGGYEFIRKRLEPMVEKVLGKHLTKANNYVGDAVLNALAKTDFVGVPSIIRWAERASGGLNSVAAPIEALFKGGTHIALDKTQESVVDQIRQWMDEGGIDGEIQRSQGAEGFAKGGEVGSTSRSFEKLYPAENIMLNQARARVSGYLNSIRPSKNQPKLPFDMDAPQRQKEKAYKKALELAANPLKIMENVNNGNLEPDDVSQLKSMWPEVYGHLSKKMTERILKAQLNGEKPPYKKRQAMSLFLGADLDSSFSAQSIAAVQGMYTAKRQQVNQAMGGSKKAISKSSSQYLTDEQSREKRMQNQK